MVPRSETVRSVIPSLCRVTTDAPPWTSTQISVSSPVFFRDHTAVIAKLCCEAGPAPAGRRRQQPGRTIVADTTLLSLDRLLRLKH
jgi:hypothetical protein